MKKSEENSVAPHNAQELTTDEIVAKIPANLYDGISGDAEDIAQARIDREQGLLASLRMAATEAESKGDFEAAKSLDREAIEIGRYFYGRK